MFTGKKPENNAAPYCVNYFRCGQSVKIPCVKINSSEHSEPHKEIILDKQLIDGIHNPLLIESVCEIFPAGIHEGALMMTDDYNRQDLKTRFLIKRGENFNIFKVMIVDKQYFLLDMLKQKFISPKINEQYYAIKWILQ